MKHTKAWELFDFNIGMLHESLRELRIALTLDPESRFALPRIARVHWYQQKYDSALVEFSTVSQPSVETENRLLCFGTLGRKKEAFKMLDQLSTILKSPGQMWPISQQPILSSLLAQEKIKKLKKKLNCVIR